MISDDEFLEFIRGEGSQFWIQHRQYFLGLREQDRLTAEFLMVRGFKAGKKSVKIV